MRSYDRALSGFLFSLAYHFHRRRRNRLHDKENMFYVEHGMEGVGDS